MILRDFQVEAIEAVWQELMIQDTALVVLPTGSGKTFTILGFCEKAFNEHETLRGVFLVNRVKLAAQTFEVAKGFLKKHVVSLCCSTLNSTDTSGQLVVATIDTISRIDFEKIDFIIADECHNVLDDGESRYSKFLDECRAQNPKLKIIGLTATPFRSTGYIYGEDELFTRVAYQKSLSWAIENNFLVKPFMFSTKEAFDTSKIRMVGGDYNLGDLEQLATEEKIKQQLDDAVDKISDRNKIVWVCTGIKHAELLAELLREKTGEEVVCVHSKMSQKDQGAAIELFRDGPVRHLSFVSIFSEGYDQPSVDCVVFMRPTRSAVRYVQTCGRGLRLFPDKQNCLILDYAQVIRECGPLDDPKIREKGQTRASLDEEGKGMRFCPSCLFYHSIKDAFCPSCSHEYVVEERDPVKSLTTKSDEGQLLLKGDDKPQWLDVVAARASWHSAKSGRECIKVIYYLKKLLADPVSDFILIDNSPFIKKKMQDKLKSAFAIKKEFENVSDLLNAVKIAISQRKFPREVQVAKQGKYINILGYRTERVYE